LEKNIDTDKIQLLYKAIEDTQSIIRFTDTKAGVILVLVGGIITIMANLGKSICVFYKAFLANYPCLGPLPMLIHIFLVGLFLVGVVHLIASIYLVFAAIAPKSNPDRSINMDLENSQINLFYLKPIVPEINLSNIFKNKDGYFKLAISTSTLIQAIDGIDHKGIITMLTIELQKVSFIRELKIQRVGKAINYFKTALYFFATIFLCTIIHNLYWG